MKMKILLIVLLSSAIPAAKATAQQSIDKLIENEVGPLVSTYKTLHAMPELPGQEYDDKVGDQIFAAIERIAKGVGIMAGLPDDRMPIVTLRPVYPVTYNTPELTDRLAKVLKRSLGDENARQQNPAMGSEDFGYLSLDKEIPSFYFWLGGADPAQYEASKKSGKELPSNHSPLFAPLPEPTIKTGVKAMTSVVLDLMKK